MLLRGTSAKSALALVGLLGIISGASAQPPAAAAKPPVPTPDAIAVGKAVGDSVGMVALPIRAAADSVGSVTGSICGRVLLGNTGASNRYVYLVEGGKVVASAKTDVNGGFELYAPHAGEFTFMAGTFEANGAVRKMVRLDAAEGATQAVVMQQKGAAPGALAGGAAKESNLESVGNRASGNAGVVFSNGQFLLNGQPVPAGNEYANLEAGSFKGAVTSVDDAGVRGPLAGANLYVIRRGQVVARATSGQGGSFTVSGLSAGGYTLLATVGGYGVAEVSLNGVPGVNQGVVQPVLAGGPPAGVAPAPFASPYFAGTTAGVPGAVAVRFPFSAIAVQRIALRDGVAAPVGAAPTADAEFRMEGADDVLVKVAFSLCCQPGGGLPAINLSPAPWEDLRLLIGNAQFDAPGIGLAPTPLADLAGAAGGFGGGGGGMGAGAFLPLLALPFLGGGGGDDNGDNPGFVSPFRPR